LQIIRETGMHSTLYSNLVGSVQLLPVDCARGQEPEREDCFLRINVKCDADETTAQLA
jgi:hypothetical protein